MDRLGGGVDVFHGVNEVCNRHEVGKPALLGWSSCSPGHRRRNAFFFAVKKPRQSASAAIIGPNSSLLASELRHVRNKVSGCQEAASCGGASSDAVAGRRGLLRFHIPLRDPRFSGFFSPFTSFST